MSILVVVTPVWHRGLNIFCIFLVTEAPLRCRKAEQIVGCPLPRPVYLNRSRRGGCWDSWVTPASAGRRWTRPRCRFYSIYCRSGGARPQSFVIVCWLNNTACLCGGCPSVTPPPPPLLIVDRYLRTPLSLSTHTVREEFPCDTANINKRKTKYPKTCYIQEVENIPPFVRSLLQFFLNSDRWQLLINITFLFYLLFLLINIQLS